ncbi:PIN domain-containing protein [Mesorhizobium sp. KR1-2]|uniref:PIN domain-containing protein n=1 Tax=Mesorhizobium sp. KR1-2 TaxID=3156609 RepID=UPI0032B57A8E
MPGARVFVDSNILLYTRDLELSEKAQSALDWMREAARRNLACANLQVLNEVTNVMLRKRGDLSPEEIFAQIDELRFLGVSPIDQQTVATARRFRLQTRYSWWDCLLLASALELGCEFFLSEDLQDGQAIEGLTIVDPFAHSPGQVFASR